MFPELFQFELPELFYRLFSIRQITIYSYPFCILIATLLGYKYFLYAQKRYISKANLKLNFLLLLLVMAYVGGKAFILLDNWEMYNNRMFSLDFYISGGFVFYGSFIFCIVSILIILYKKNLPIFKYLDLIAIMTAIVHSIGRLGCFLAGCCYGKPTDLLFGVNFPKNGAIAVHPTQLYEASFIILLLILLIRLLKYKNNGTVFIIYIFAYAIWRFMLEYLRGDQRGYVFSNLFSHSQLIALMLIILLSTFLFIRFRNLKFTH